MTARWEHRDEEAEAKNAEWLDVKGAERCSGCVTVTEGGHRVPGWACRRTEPGTVNEKMKRGSGLSPTVIKNCMLACGAGKLVEKGAGKKWRVLWCSAGAAWWVILDFSELEFLSLSEIELAACWKNSEESFCLLTMARRSRKLFQSNSRLRVCCRRSLNSATYTKTYCLPQDLLSSLLTGRASRIKTYCLLEQFSCMD